MYRRIAVLAAVTAVLVAVSYVVRPDLAATTQPTQRPTTELDRLIDLFAERAPEREESLEYLHLGSLFLQRADRDSSVDDYRGATDAFRRSLDLGGDRPQALDGHARAALGIHHFTAAVESARTLQGLLPDDPNVIALVGDVAFGIGDYETADAAFDRLDALRGDDPAVMVRLAQLATVRSPTEAPRLAAAATERARETGLRDADLAFYQSFEGNLAFERGDFERAIDLLESAVANAPDDHGALGELARVLAATGSLEEAVELLERANALVPEPDHLVLQGDLRARLGDITGASRDYDAAVAEATRSADHERAWARALATHLLDHDGDVAWALDIAAAELSVRRDVGAWDLSAWAHYRAGDLAAARSAIDTALSFGVADATVWFHAGAISAAEGETIRAIDELTTALEINPGFDPLLAIEARRLLTSLGG